jgi:hypothetical protein
VAADAYFQKSGFGFQPLLPIISNLVSKAPLRTAPPPIDNEPVRARLDEDGQYLIGCGDCLREFSAPRVFQMSPDETWSTCVHCGKHVQFLVAEHSKGK